MVTGLTLLSSVSASAFVSQVSPMNPLPPPPAERYPVKLKKKPAHRSAANPALVTDLRIKHYPERVRIVFDLQRSVTFSQTRKKRPDRVIVELQNTRLTQTVQHKADSFALPGDLTISQSKPHAVTVALYLDKISDFKLVPLKEPDRLVLEVYYPTDQRQDPLGQTGEQAAAAAVSPGIASPAPLPPAPAPSGATEPMMVPPSPSQPPQLKALRRPVRDDIKTIVIDPGHGGKDPGAIGRGKVQEKTITLKVGMKLRDLITARLGRKVLMTRERDVFVELEDRTKFANHHDADLFVSIHVNSHPQRSARGLEIYHFGKASDRRALEVAARENGTPLESTGIGWQYLVADLLTDKKIQDSLELAWTARQAMVAHLNGYYDVVDLGVKTAPFYVLRFTTMPSILAEIGFVSNPTEERLMQGDAFLTRMAEAIFDGLKAFINPLQTAGGKKTGYGVGGKG
jgi:N-acetylmuramoyl-L-alanine amidase